MVFSDAIRCFNIRAIKCEDISVLYARFKAIIIYLEQRINDQLRPSTNDAVLYFSLQSSFPTSANSPTLGARFSIAKDLDFQYSFD